MSLKRDMRRADLGTSDMSTSISCTRQVRIDVFLAVPYVEPQKDKGDADFSSSFPVSNGHA